MRRAFMLFTGLVLMSVPTAGFAADWPQFRGPEFELLQQNKLDEMFWASTAAADGAIYLRSVDHLYCIAE